jgi:phenylacetic acid degradation operon negative regulatory protein
MQVANSNLGSRAFVLGMMSEDGTLVADPIYTVGEHLGFTPHQIRLVLARLVEEGSFTREGRGRQAVLRTTDRYTTLHEPELEWLRLAYRQDAGLSPWDRQWCLVAFGLDEERRSARNALRELLTALVAAPLAPGVYVHAHDISANLTAAATTFGVLEQVSVARATTLVAGGRQRPEEVAAHLWPIASIADEYRTFVSEFGPAVRQRRAVDPIDELARGFELVSAFRQCAQSDPLLPPELLPPRWPGRQAREVLRRCSARLVTAREAVGVPALFSRYDRLFDDIHTAGPITSG